MTHPSKARAVAIIRAAYDSAPEIYSGFARVIQDTLADECEAAERQHRRYGHPRVAGFSVQTAAMYFAVKYVREYMLKTDRIPDVKSYLHMRHECFTAASIVLNYGAELTAWVKSIPAEFDQIDYARMMQCGLMIHPDRAAHNRPHGACATLRPCAVNLRGLYARTVCNHSGKV